jgi:hypothetical protein
VLYSLVRSAAFLPIACKLYIYYPER